MRNKIIQLILLTVFSGLGISCYDDKGNYNYEDINEVKIGGILQDRPYDKFAFLDTLEIHPTIEGTFYKDDLSHYSYEWKLIPERGASEEEDYIVSQEKNLVLPVVVKPGEYSGFFKVKDNVGKTEWGVQFSVNVTTMTTEGWMVLCEDEGKARMDLIAHTSETEVRVARDIWREKDYQTGKPYRLFFDYDAARMTTLLTCEAGTYVLDDNLEAGEPNNLKWMFGTGPERVDVRGTGSVQASNKAINREYLIDKYGDLYFREWLNPGSLFDYPMNWLDGERIELAPWVGAPLFDRKNPNYSIYGHSTLFYDNTNKRFVQLPDNATKLGIATFTGAQMGTGEYELIYMQSILDSYTYAIFQKPGDDQYYIYKMSLLGRGNLGVSWKAYTLKGGSDIRKFAFEPVDANHTLFYATDHEVYRLNLSSGNIKSVLTDFDNEIAVLKFNPVTTWSALKDWEVNKRRWLVVGLTDYNIDDEGACGTVKFYEYSKDRDRLVLKMQVPEEGGQKLGKIVDITYRER